MKRKLFSVLFIMLVAVGFSQGLVNNGAYLVMTSGSHIYIDGDANGGYTNSGAAYINSNGRLTLEGDWINNGTTDVYTSIDNSGSTVFKGTTLQEIGGSHSTTFENLTLNNTGDGAYVSSDEKIQNNLTMTDGDFDLRDNDVELVDATSSVLGEGELNRLKSTDGSSDGYGTGTIYTIRTNPTGNVANLGLDFTPDAALGSTKFIRGHERQQGSGSYSSNYSVFRYYEFQPTNIETITVNEFHYWGGSTNPELNGHTESELDMFQNISTGGTHWAIRNSTVNTSSDYVASSMNDDDVSGILRITLASSAAPLPIELTSFTATCQDGGKLIKWTTASEINNDYFTIEKSTNGIDFYTFITLAGVGNSNVVNSYDYFDAEESNATVYYRLSQTDYDGNEQTFNPVSVNCSSGSSTDDNFFIINNPAQEYVKLRLTGTQGNQYVLSFIDHLGQQLTSKKVILRNTNQIMIINTARLSEGIYTIVFWTEKKIISKQVIIIR